MDVRGGGWWSVLRSYINYGYMLKVKRTKGLDNPHLMS